MKKNIATIFLCLVTKLLVFGQGIIQLEGIGDGSLPVFEVLDLTVNHNGDKIIAGRLRTTTTSNSSISHDFDPSNNVVELPNLGPSAGQVGFIASYDFSGSLNYVNQISDSDIPPTTINILIDSDSQNNIFVLGLFVGKADLDPSDSIEEVNSGNINASGFYLASYDVNGAFRFGVQLPNIFNIVQSSIFNNNEYNKILEVDDDGNSYLLVQPNDDEYDFDPGPNEFVIPFGKAVISYDNSGNFRYGYLVPLESKDIGSSPNGTHYITGVLNESFEDTFDFDPSENIFTLNDVGNNSFFVASYNQEGELNFVNDLKGPNAIPSIVSGNDSGDVFLVGKMSGTIDFDPSSSVFNVVVSEFESDPSGDFFIARYNSIGELQMAKAIEDKINNVSNEVITDMEVDTFGNFIFTGSLNGGIVDFDSSSQSLDVSGSPSGTDIFVASYDELGNPIFAYSVENSLENFSSLELDLNCTFYHLATNIRENASLEFFQNNIGFNVTTGSESTSNLYSMLLLTIASENILPNSDCDILNVQMFDQISNINIHPNPFNNNILIHLDNYVKIVQINILDILGQIVYSSSSNVRNVDLEHLESGTYILSLSTETEKASFKIIKQ